MRWALNLLHGAALADRVYGPDAHAAGAGAVRRRGPAGLPVRLDRADPRPAGRRRCERDVPGAEDRRRRAVEVPRRPARARTAEIADRIRASGARLVLVGLGCPRQEIFAYAMRPLLDMPLLAVGAAFDYHAGLLRKPPAWMQRRGAGVAVAARPGAAPAVAAVRAPQPGLPRPAGGPEGGDAEVPAAGGRRRAARFVPGLGASRRALVHRGDLDRGCRRCRRRWPW